MRELLQPLRKFTRTDQPIVLARVLTTWGSSPRPVGSVLLISREMEMAGSVSGGCVEGEVLRNAQQIFDGEKQSIGEYGVSDEMAWSAGLTCGGKLEVMLQVINPSESWWQSVVSCLESDEAGAVVTCWGPSPKNSFINQRGEVTGDPVPAHLIQKALEMFTTGNLTFRGESYFIQIFPPKYKLILIGAAHITADLVYLASYFDFYTIVVDPRQAFAGKTHFPVKPDRLIEEYPSEILPQLVVDRWTYAVVLSHDPKIDDNALTWLLNSDVAYIGALGSRRSQEKRKGRLSAAGFSAKQLTRISGPVGINIHGRTAREIALSIMAEIILQKNHPEASQG